MLQDGLIQEVANLYQPYYLEDKSLVALKAIGYRQVCSYLSGKMQYNEMCDRAIIATRQLAKRQCTWLRNWKNLYSFDCRDQYLLAKMIKLISNYNNLC